MHTPDLLLDSMMDSGDMRIALLDREFRYVRTSRGYAHPFDSTPEELVGKRLSDYLGESIYFASAVPNLKACLTGEQRDFESWVNYPTLGRQYLRVTYTPLYTDDDPEPTHILVWLYDLTALKAAEERHALESSRLQAVITGTRAGTWEWNPQTGEAHLNERWAEILGYTLAELEPVSIKTWISLTHPEDLNMSDRHLRRHFSGQTDYYECEARMRHKDGHWVWILDRGRVVEWRDGRPWLMFGSHVEITQRKQEEAKLKETLAALERSENQLRNLANSVPGVLLRYRLNPDGSDELLFASEQIMDIWGIPRDIAVVDNSPVWERVHPDDLGQLRDSIIASASAHTFWYETFRVIHPDGCIKWLDGRGTPQKQPDGSTIWDTLILDVTERHEVAMELQDTNLRMQIATDAAEIGIWELDLSSNKLTWDIWMCRLYGISEESFNGNYHAWENALHPDDREHTVTTFQQALDTFMPFCTRFRIVRPDGEIRYLQVHASAILDKYGKAERVIGVNYDVTEEVIAGEKLRKSEAEARAADKAKTAFLNMMNHELRTPLNAIIGPIEMLEAEDLSGEGEEMLGVVKHASQHLLTLINAILNLSKIQAGKFETSIEPVDLTVCMYERLAIFNNQAKAKGIKLATTVDPTLPKVIETDGRALAQILMNLMSNAIKFTDAGSVSVTVDRHPLDDGRTGVRFRVADTGIGVREADLQRIFEPFQQADMSTVRSHGGTGLGLAISCELANLLGGKLAARSTVGKGSEFSLTIPLSESIGAATKPEAAKEAGSPAVQPAERPKPEVLIVEDDPASMAYMRMSLARLHVETTLATCGRDAVEAFARKPARLVLMDIRLPDISGQEAAQQIRQLPGGDACTMVACTAFATEEFRERLLTEGSFDGFLAKPVKSSELQALITQVAMAMT